MHHCSKWYYDEFWNILDMQKLVLSFLFLYRRTENMLHITIQDDSFDKPGKKTEMCFKQPYLV